MSFLLTEAWFHQNFAIVFSLLLLALRVALAVRRRMRPTPHTWLCVEASERIRLRVANGTTNLQLLVWGFAIVDLLELGESTHFFIYAQQAMFFSFEVVATGAGILVILALDAIGRVAALPQGVRWRYSPWSAVLASVLLVTMSHLLAVGWATVAHFEGWLK